MALTLNLSRLRRDENGQRLPRELVLTCSTDESYNVKPLLYQQVLRQAGLMPVEPSRDFERDIARFKLPVHLLEKVQLTFPYAHLSPGLHSKIMRAARAEYEEVPVPDITVRGLHGELMGHQKIAIGNIMEWYYPAEGGDSSSDCYFLNDEMGLGKTLVALATRKLVSQREASGGQHHRTLAVVPNSIKYISWAADAAKFFPTLDVHVIDSDRQTPEERSAILLNPANSLVIINWESLWRLPEVTQVEWDLFVADEYHRAKNAWSRQSLGFREVKFRKALFMSGTGILNGRPEELWPVLNMAWPVRFPDLNYFMTQHIIKRRGNPIVAYRDLDVLREVIRPAETRRRKDQVLRDLPAKIYNRHMVTMSVEQRRIYDRILDEMVFEREEYDEETGITHVRPVPVVNILSQLTRCKQAAWGPELFGGRKKSAKVDKVKELVAELTENNEKAIIFTQWATAANILRRELMQYNPAFVTGDVRVSARTEEVRKFQEDDDCQVFIGTIGSCKEGITLTAGSYVIFTDKGWTPAENEQAAARAHRIGQHRTVNVIEIFSQDTVEADIEDLLQRKQNVFTAIVERDGGLRNDRVGFHDLREILERSQQ